jgi:glycosyltransferase involved in cell wall biosynthesis
MAKARIRGEVVISDNGSTDGSQLIAKAAGARVVKETVRGYGAALRGGIQAARGRFILMADADRSYDLTGLPRFVEKLRQGFDLVQGSRLKGTILKGAMPWTHRWFGTPLINLFLRILSDVRVSDSQCGMRAFTREAFRAMGTTSTGMEFASEMLVKAARLRLKIAEVPIRYRPDGRNRPPHLRAFADGWRHLRLIMLLSPVSLLLVPGVAQFVLGAGLILASFVHLEILGHALDFHFAILGSALILIGYQVAHLGFAMALLRRVSAHQTWPRLLTKVFSLERVLVWGTVIGLVGLGMDLRILFYWLTVDFEVFSRTMTIIGILGTTLILLGVEIILGGFFLASIIGLESEKDIR